MTETYDARDRIWLCQASNESMLRKAWNDPKQEDIKLPLLDPQLYALGDKMARSEPINAAEIPDWFYEPTKSKPLVRPNHAHLFYANAFGFISPQVKAVFDRHDMGDNLIKSVTLFQNDRKTPAHEGFCVLYVCQLKNTFLPEHSPNARQPYGPDFDVWDPPVVLEGDNRMSLSEKALQGADLWVEQRVFRTVVFLSDRLVANLRAEGLVNEYWGLRACPVVAV
ncbi:hypothetical protein ACN2XU_09550 [Primorskyibacter sp. 2E107]|uniref:hypothetical protein n=1 Tax=Primorskyibacter sp. 2E107 TaxID=3403458 RepID=UPI003AF84FFC